MGKKGTDKKAGKNAKKSVGLTTYHKRGTNRISIVFPGGKKSIEKIETLLINYEWAPVEQQMKSHKKKHPVTKRMEYVPPKSFYVILKLVKPRNKEQYYSEIAPVDMVVNLDNIQDLTIEIINNLFESWTSANDIIQGIEDGDLDPDEIAAEGTPIEYMNKFDIRYLKEIIYHFIYLQ